MGPTDLTKERPADSMPAMNIVAIPGFTEPFSSFTHLFSTLFFFVAAFFLVYRGRGNLGRQASLVIYSFGLVFVFSMSGVYHLLDEGRVSRYVLKVLDHAAIWTMIAGTFTPLHIILFRGLKRWIVLILVWIMAIVGLVLTTVFFQSVPEWLTLAFYISVGWMGLFTFLSIKSEYPNWRNKLLLWGGVAYTIGGVLEFCRWPVVWAGVVGPHELFHIFVMIGAGIHWFDIYNLSCFPLSSNLIFIVKEHPDKNHYVAKATSENVTIKASSVEELHEKINSWVQHSFKANYIPKSITLRYLKEETL